MRQIVLDTETTGLEPEEGHRIIEIGCVELVNRRLTGRHYHQYINPDREIDEGAIEVHGITNEFLNDKPRFAQIAAEFLEFVDGADLIIHNAPFDVGFINHEFKGLKLGHKPIEHYCKIIDTLIMARQKHPGQRNSLDALCRRYEVDNSHRELHGALLDAEILADVYLLMTGGQVGLALSGDTGDSQAGDGIGGNSLKNIKRLANDRKPLPVITASEEDLMAHREKIQQIEQASEGQCLWQKMAENST